MKKMDIIDKHSFVSDIVKKDYRTALVFRRHGIEFCCGAKFPLELVCSIKGVNLETIQKELRLVSQTIAVPTTLRFGDWDTAFLADYIEQVHHTYLKIMLPSTLQFIQQFSEGHQKKFTYLPELLTEFSMLTKELLSHIKYEEEIIFPYIKQIAFAHKGKESYASLLMRTLSKPIKELMYYEHNIVEDALEKLRTLTNYYAVPLEACTSHKVSFLTLQEVDRDIVQHLHLENNILFPKTIQIEKELLKNIY